MNRLRTGILLRLFVILIISSPVMAAGVDVVKVDARRSAAEAP